MKKVIIIPLLMGFITASFSLAKSQSSNRKTIESLFAAINSHDWEKVGSYYADQVNMTDPQFGSFSKTLNRQEVISHYQEIGNFLPNLNDSLVNMVVENDQVVVEFIARGHINDQEEFSLPICTVFTLKNGKIKKDATYYDVLNNQ